MIAADGTPLVAAARSNHAVDTAARRGGRWLAAGAGLFWLAWACMPGVGVTDAAEIFRLVSAHRGLVQLSVVLQLLSAACYAPALIALALRARQERAERLVSAAVWLLIGAMGSAADSIFHWLAVEMTAPGLSQAEFLPVMARMQGPALVAVGPLIAAFFIGTFMLVRGARSAGWVGAGCIRLALASPLPLALLAVLPNQGRLVGLAFLAGIAGCQLWVAVGLASRTGDGSRAGA